jgi:exodeoxyribonuclease X
MILVVDTETTGLFPETDRVCELAAVEVLTPGVGNGATYNYLVNPGRSIPAEASAVHHITDEDVENAMSLQEACTLLPGSKAEAYAAHNAAFDKSFLKGLPDRPWVCSWKCAMSVWPDAPGYGNQVLRYYLGFSVPVAGGRGAFPHSALYDALTTAGILLRLLEVKPLEELIKISSEPVLLRKMPFGKHKGMLFKDVPRDYLRWLFRQTDLDEDLAHTLRHHLP